MKLATRMTLTLGACALVLFGGSGWLQLRSEERELYQVARDSTLLLAKSLATAFENALRDRQLEDVAETLGVLARVDPDVSVFVFDSQGRLAGLPHSALPSDATRRMERLARERAEPIVDWAREESPPRLRIGIRLFDEARGGSAALVLEKPLDDSERDLRATRIGIAATTALFVFSVLLLAWFLSRRYLGSPLARMVEEMRRVRAGESAEGEGAASLRGGPAEQALSGKDEVGAARAEFDALVRDLEEARVRARREFDARRRMERGLQDVDKLITLGQLSAVMAHEIGSPLQILEGRARALHKHAEDVAATRRTADLLIEQSGRITRIVEQMASISRRRTPHRRRLDVSEPVRRVVELLELEARRREVRFDVAIAGPTEAFVDADQLQQVILNLTRNALDASPAGGVVSVRLHGAPDVFVLEVEDEGDGLSAEARAHLFEPFFTSKGETGGSGLGLSAAHAIVREHRGSIEFAEGRERGCLVRVILPRLLEDPSS